MGTGLAISAQCGYNVRALGQYRNCPAIKAFKYHRNVFPIPRVWQTYRTQNPVLKRAWVQVPRSVLRTWVDRFAVDRAARRRTSPSPAPGRFRIWRPTPRGSDPRVTLGFGMPLTLAPWRTRRPSGSQSRKTGMMPWNPNVGDWYCVPGTRTVRLRSWRHGMPRMRQVPRSSLPAPEGRGRFQPVATVARAARDKRLWCRGMPGITGIPLVRLAALRGVKRRRPECQRRIGRAEELAQIDVQAEPASHEEIDEGDRDVRRPGDFCSGYK